MYVCVSLCGCVHMSAASLRGRRQRLKVELETQAIMSHPAWVLDTKLLSSARAVTVLHH